ncbi:MAG: right-handed parallel beta-helix repeat-containing protein [Deltaproteobacteria bacterium]|nr:right-handed parallel beta-helix repeat-containing protein [Deltaproteobacteria bacterium]
MSQRAFLRGFCTCISAILLLTFGCKDKAKETEDAGMDASTEEDSGADTDTDIDTDTGTGEDTDTGTEPEMDAGSDTGVIEPDASIEEDAGPDLGCVRYVDIDGPGGEVDGLSWDSAFNDLQAGIESAREAASSIEYCDVWVAEGNYSPATEGLTDERTATFQLRPKVHVYGGFSPATGAIVFDERVPLRFKTVLTGEIQADIKYANNVYHVVTGSNSAVLDGVFITGGYADGPDDDQKSGAGMINHKCSPEIVGVTFLRNTAEEYGGGMFNRETAAPVIRGSSFELNSADSGGGIFNQNASPTISDCTFELNSADLGGGMANAEGGDSRATDCVFEKNSAQSGGGMANNDTSPTITDSIFEENESTGTESGQGGGGIYNNADSNPTMTGVTLRGNSAQVGGGMFNNASSPIVTDCMFQSNTAVADESGGGGMYNLQSSPVVTGSYFKENAASGSDSDGGGIYNNDSTEVSFLGSVFWGNSASDDGAGILSDADSTMTVTNCIFYKNTASGSASSTGGGIHAVGTDTEIVNCTFYRNSADQGSAVEAGGTLNIVNSILWDNGAPQISGTPTSVTYSNLDQDPLFEDPSNGNLHLQLGSPCIDTGDNSVVPDIAPDAGTDDPSILDIDGNLRIINGTVDMGADEAAFKFVDADAQGTNDGTSWKDAFLSLQDALDEAGYGYQILVAEGTYKPEKPDGREATFLLPEGVMIYGGFDPTPGGAPISDAGLTDAGLNPAGGFDARDWKTHKTILSGDLGVESDSSDNAFHVVTGSAKAMLDGLNISGGAADGEGEQSYGGGILNKGTSPAVTNCLIRNNSAQYGGGMANLDGASPVLTNTSFENNNSEYYGGAMYNSKSLPQMNNCIFISNTSHAGGGMANQEKSNPRIINCTFYKNTAEYAGGGIYNHDSFPIVSNTILFGSDASEESQIHVVTNVTYSNVQGICMEDPSCGGAGNIDMEPGFIDDDDSDGEVDLRLTPVSICIDIGDNTAGITALDMDGNPRNKVGNGGSGEPVVDLGAYEFQGN